jgi:hypothetical protein
MTSLPSIWWLAGIFLRKNRVMATIGAFFFDKGNAYTLQKLQEKFADKKGKPSHQE